MCQFTNFNCRLLTHCCTLMLLVLSVFACSSGNSNNETTSNQNQSANSVQSDDIAQVGSFNAALLDDNTWLLGPYTYHAQTSSQHMGDNNTVIVIASTLEQDEALGFYSGAGMAITMTDSGEGIYALIDADGVMNAANSGSAVLSLSVNVGLNNTEPPVATRWSTVASTGIAQVTQGSDGRYFVSIVEPITLSRDINFGDGIPNSADQMQIVMKNIHGMSL